MYTLTLQTLCLAVVKMKINFIQSSLPLNTKRLFWHCVYGVVKAAGKITLCFYHHTHQETLVTETCSSVI